MTALSGLNTFGVEVEVGGTIVRSYLITAPNADIAATEAVEAVRGMVHAVANEYDGTPKNWDDAWTAGGHDDLHRRVVPVSSWGFCGAEGFPD